MSICDYMLMCACVCVGICVLVLEWEHHNNHVFHAYIYFFSLSFIHLYAAERVLCVCVHYCWIQPAYEWWQKREPVLVACTFPSTSLACLKSNWAHVNELAQRMTPKSFPFPWCFTLSFVVGCQHKHTYTNIHIVWSFHSCKFVCDREKDSWMLNLEIILCRI